MVASLVGTAVLLAIVGWLLRSGSGEPTVEAGEVVLRYPRGVTLFGWGVLAAGGALTAFLMSASTGLQSAGDVWALAALCLFFLVCAAPFLFARRWEWVRITTDAIEGRTVFSRRPTTIAWADVRSVSFGRISGYLTIESTDGRRVRASALLSDITALADLVHRQFSLAGGSESAQMLREYRSAYGG